MRQNSVIAVSTLAQAKDVLQHELAIEFNSPPPVLLHWLDRAFEVDRQLTDPKRIPESANLSLLGVEPRSAKVPMASQAGPNLVRDRVCEERYLAAQISLCSRQAALLAEG